ncbi:hypothetical protein [Cellulomonas iranensis]|uniref:hypothetical protein n=1 Tax=Cellulomonas iranensis TaxID=76862 RepID=UPI003D7C3CEE
MRDLAGEDAESFLVAVEQAGLTRLLALPLRAVRSEIVTLRTLLTVLREQLVKQCMEPQGIQDGIYVGYWTPVEQRNPKNPVHPDPAALRALLLAQADALLPVRKIAVVVLDVGRADRAR